MNPSIVRQLFDIAAIIIMVAVPFVVLIFPQYPIGLLSFRRRWIIAIISGWVLVITHQLLYLRFDHLNPLEGDIGSDFGEMMVMVLGWALIMFGSVPSLLICAVDDYRRNRGLSGIIKPFKKKSAEQAGAPNP